MLPAADSYETLAAAFAWKVPAHYNIGVDACDKWADGSGRLALIYETREGSETRFTFDDLKALSNQFANALARGGLSAATAWGYSCRSRRRRPSRIWPSTRRVISRCRCFSCSASMPSSTGSPIAAQRR